MVRFRASRFIGIVLLGLSFILLGLTFLGIIQNIYEPTGESTLSIGVEYTFLLFIILVILAAICLSIESDQEHK